MKAFLCSALMCGMLLIACKHAHTFSVDDEVDVSIKITPEVTFDAEFIPLETITKTSTEGKGEYCRRFIVEAWYAGKRVRRQTTALNNDDRNIAVALPLTLYLHPQQYTLVVWSDYVRATDPQSDLFYSTADLSNVVCRDPYTGNTLYRDVFCGITSLDLRSYPQQSNTGIKVHIDMFRPQARYQIIATDVKEFLKKNRRAANEEISYSVTFAYDYYFPAGFSVLRGKPGDGRMNIMFTTPMSLSDSNVEECMIGTDDVFAEQDGSFLSLTISVRDKEGKVLTRVTGLEVPYKRGYLTTIRGKFLTSGKMEGINIDPDYEGKVDIDLDKFFK